MFRKQDEDVATIRARSMKRFLFNVFLANLGILAVVGALVFMWKFSHSAGHDWRVRYTNEYGDACCDEIDCREIKTNVALRLRLGELAKVGEHASERDPSDTGRPKLGLYNRLFVPAVAELIRSVSVTAT